MSVPRKCWLMRLVLGGLLVCSMLATQVWSAEYKIGVYYFPGWKDFQRGNPYPRPWEKIKPYPEREPKLGWYAEGQQEVMAKQLAWMNQYGIRYVVFDWFLDREGGSPLEHALTAYLSLPDRHGVDFAVMWANHTEYNFSREQFQALFRLWARRYFSRRDYVKVDGVPVVFIFSASVLNRNAKVVGMSTAQLTAMADSIAKAEGLPGVRFVGGTGASAGNGFDYSANSGYSGFSAYNFHGPATFRYAGGRTMSHSYSEFDLAYRDQWKWMLKNASGFYVLPMSSGWDKRPWGGSGDPAHDNSIGTSAEFEQHLLAARAMLDSYPGKTRRMGVICCWNEFGEGSFIEPTKKDGFSYLEKVRKVFGSGAKQ